MTDISRKDAILQAAVACFREHGRKTTIAEIGRRAGVADSIIYHYFKNKEDLLFHAAGEQVKAMAADLAVHLSRFDAPLDRFREFLRFQLHYHDTHPNYTNLTIFECRSKLSFFRHDAFRHFRAWTRVMTGILNDGTADGVVRPDLPLALFRDAVFGLLDMASIQSLADGDGHPAHRDVPAMMTLVAPMLAPTPGGRETPDDKARRILDAARHLFADKGYDRTATADIAKRAGVAEGTLYEYFKNKEDLLFSCIGDRLCAHAAQVRDLGAPSARVLLEQMLRHHFLGVFSEPDFMKLLVFEGMFNKRFYRSSAQAAYRSYAAAFDPVLARGRDEGVIRPDIDSRIFRNLFLGLTGHMTLRWSFTENPVPIDKAADIRQAIDLLMRAVCVQAS
ncbi:hypothetical protein JCM14469_34730 [Desulfatiferula olefinivorans]